MSVNAAVMYPIIAYMYSFFYPPRSVMPNFARVTPRLLVSCSGSAD